MANFKNVIKRPFFVWKLERKGGIEKGRILCDQTIANNYCKFIRNHFYIKVKLINCGAQYSV